MRPCGLSKPGEGRPAQPRSAVGAAQTRVRRVMEPRKDCVTAPFDTPTEDRFDDRMCQFRADDRLNLFGPLHATRDEIGGHRPGTDDDRYGATCASPHERLGRGIRHFLEASERFEVQVIAEAVRQQHKFVLEQAG